MHEIAALETAIDRTDAEVERLRQALAALERDQIEGITARRKQQAEADAGITRLRAIIADRETKLAALRNTISFRLGQALLRAKTPRGLLNLPGELMALRKGTLARRRRTHRCII